MSRPIWRLSVMTYRGVGIGAQHSYGVITAPRQVVEQDGELFSVGGQTWALMRVLTEETAETLNRLNERFGRDYATSNKAGEWTQQFDSDEEVEAAGVATFAKVCDDPSAILLLGSTAAAGPQKVLAGPDDAREALTPIWEADEAEDARSWSAAREDAYDRWEEAIRSLDYDDYPASRKGVRHGAGVGYPKAPLPLDAYVRTEGNALVVTIEEKRS